MWSVAKAVLFVAFVYAVTAFYNGHHLQKFSCTGQLTQDRGTPEEMVAPEIRGDLELSSWRWFVKWWDHDRGSFQLVNGPAALGTQLVLDGDRTAILSEPEDGTSLKLDIERGKLSGFIDHRNEFAGTCSRQ